MILEERFPNTGTRYEVSSENTDALLALYPKVKGFRFNFVLSTDSYEQSSNSISNTLDRLVLKFIRSQSDLIITSGATARAEKLSASVHAPLLILTQGQVEFDIPAVSKESTTSVYLTQKLGTEYRNSKALAVGRFQDSPPEFAASFCKSNQFEAVVLEAGLFLGAQFARAGKLNEVDLTVTKVKTQEQATAEARQLLALLGLADYELLLLLYLEDSWFFRFGNRSAKLQ